MIILSAFFLLLSLSPAPTFSQNEQTYFKKISELHKYSEPADYSSFYENFLSEIISIHPENTKSPHNLYSIVSDISCPENNKCCEELQNANFRYRLELTDASGTFRTPGYKSSGFVPAPPLHSHNEYLASDGVQVQCQRIERNETEGKFGGKYCLSGFTISEWNRPQNNVSSFDDKIKLSMWNCVPDSCSAESLNEFLEGSRSSYRYCLSSEYIYTWEEIVGWCLIAVLILFLIFSPIKEMRIINSLNFLGDFRQSESAIKSIHGIRVLSLCWVCVGHSFVNLTFQFSTNALDMTKYIAVEYPIMTIILNSTFSVDTFFTIGGLVAGYVTTRKVIKTMRANKETTEKTSVLSSILKTGKSVIMAAVMRFLRLTPSIFALMFLVETVMNHKQDEPTHRIPTDEDTTFQGQAESCAGDGWIGPSFYLQTWVVGGGTNNGFAYCVGWLWYVSCEFWYFLLVPVFIALLCTEDRVLNQKRNYGGYILGGVMIAGQTGALLWLGDYCKFYFSSFAFQGNENYIHTAEVQPEECVSSLADQLWPQEYTAPFYRFAPYVIGVLVGHWMAERGLNAQLLPEKSNQSKNLINLAISTRTGYILQFLTIFGLFFIVFSPLPIAYHTTFYPQWIANIYTALSRPVWGCLICAFIVLLEAGFDGFGLSFLKSDYFLIFSKMNMSAYFIHYYILIWFMQVSLKQAIYVTPELGLIFGGICCVGMYIFGGIFFVLFERPLAILSNKLIGRLQNF